MIVIDRMRTHSTATPAQWQKAADELRRQTCIHIPGFLAPALLGEVRELLAGAEFARHRHGGLALDERLKPGPLSALLLLALNDPALLRLVERLADRGPLGGFEGRVYRMRAADGHYDTWHSDAGRDRRVALSVNLNREIVATAPLQIRRRDCDTVLHEFANAIPGDAVLFTIDDSHVHRIKPMAAAGERIACSGWFYAGADMRDRLTHPASAFAGRHQSKTRSKT